MHHPKILRLLCIYCCSLSFVFGQIDSNRFVWKAWQVELGSGINYRNPVLNENFLKAIMAQDPSRFTTLTGFTDGSTFNSVATNFNGLVSAKLFFKSRAEKRKQEVFVGLRYGESALATVGYFNNRIDTLSTQKDPATGQTNVTLKRTLQNYTMSLYDRRLYLPFGINLSTDQARLIWLSCGLELSPFISFAYQLSILGGDEVSQATVGAGSSGAFFPSTFFPPIITIDQTIKGYGTGIYFGLPLAIHVQPFHKINSFMKHFNFFAGLTPLVVTVKTTYSDSQTNLHLIVQTGVRAGFR